MLRRSLISLLLLVGCAATEGRALTREQRTVLIASLDAAAPRVVDGIREPAARRRMKTELAELRSALESANARALARSVADVRRLHPTDAELELVLHEAETAAQQFLRRTQ